MGVITHGEKVLVNLAGEVFGSKPLFHFNSNYGITIDASNYVSRWKDYNKPNQIIQDTSIYKPYFDITENAILLDYNKDARLLVPMSKEISDFTYLSNGYSIKFTIKLNNIVGTKTIAEFTLSNNYTNYIHAIDNDIYMRISIPIKVVDLSLYDIVNDYLTILIVTDGITLNSYVNNQHNTTIIDTNQFKLTSSDRIVLGNNLRRGDFYPLDGYIKEFIFWDYQI